MELKIFTIVFAMNWVFEIDESHFKPGTPSFGLMTQDKLIAKIK